MSKSKEYSNGEVTVVWKPDVCIHSGNCVRGLPSVFRPNDKPWIKIDAASTEEIKAQVDKCPSGALSYYMNDADKTASAKDSQSSVCKMDLIDNGPIIVHGPIEMSDKEGNIKTVSGKTALCRCGASGNKPFCDGTHNKIEFKA